MIKPFTAASIEGFTGYLLFSAPWCVPCKTMHPILEKSEYTVYEVNVDEHPQLASDLNINGIPTIVYFENGKEVSAILGGQPIPRIHEFLKTPR
jgi:thioredoxin-like negative regulator of GroEL